MFWNCGLKFFEKGLKWASENAQNNIATKYQNMNMSAIFGGFRGLNNSTYQISEATFQ